MSARAEPSVGNMAGASQKCQEGGGLSVVVGLREQPGFLPRRERSHLKWELLKVGPRYGNRAVIRGGLEKTQSQSEVLTTDQMTYNIFQKVSPWETWETTGRQQAEEKERVEDKNFTKTRQDPKKTEEKWKPKKMPDNKDNAFLALTEKKFPELRTTQTPFLPPSHLLLVASPNIRNMYNCNVHWEV